jgi:hypothetical protein
MSNSWYLENFPIDPDIIDCRNCLEHNPPTFDAENCVFCTAFDAHMTCNRAKECATFTSYLSDVSTVDEITEIVEYPSLGALFNLEKDIDKVKEQIKKKEEKKEEVKEDTEWKPQSQLDAKILDFNDTTIPAALRAMFDVLKGMEKRLTSIEEKMPANNTWKVKDFFKNRKKAIVTRKNRYKWKIKGKIRVTRIKAKAKKAGFGALFSPKEKKTT